MGEIIAIIRLLGEIVTGLKALAKFISEHKEEKWFRDSAELFSKWKDAKTSDEKKDLVRGIGDVWSRL